MVFSSLAFIFGFLPACILITAIFRKNVAAQNGILLLASILFYSWGEPSYIWLFLFTVTINWLATFIVRDIDKRSVRRAAGIAAIILDLAILFWFKYAGWIGGELGLLSYSIVLPIGISFYTFQAISYVADVTLLEKYNAEKNPVNVALYISFFPQLIAGPIVRFEEMKNQIRDRHLSWDTFEKGSFRFIVGFCKKVLLADSMAVIVNKAFSAGDSLTFTFAWLGAIAYTFQILMDFSGYSDMAIGLGAMFGFRLPENFNCPYKAWTIRDFWRRWHITLSIWFRDYVYIPLGGNRKDFRTTIINISVVWLLTGFWHGANFTFVLWGVMYGALVLFEKLTNIETLLAKKNKVVRVIYRLITLLFIILLWVLFRSDSISVAKDYFHHMLIFDTNHLDETILYLKEFQVAVIGCMLMSAIHFDRIEEKRTMLWPVAMILFIISVSYLVKGTFSPFLYFNF